MNFESNDITNLPIDESEDDNNETYDNAILMNRDMLSDKLKCYYDLFHKDEFLCNLLTKLEEVELLSDFIVLVK